MILTNNPPPQKKNHIERVDIIERVDMVERVDLREWT